MGAFRTIRMLTYGFLAGTAGVKILSSDDAKKVYTHITAAAMRGIDDVVKTATVLKENCDDIAADAKDINEERYKKAREKEIEDAKKTIAEAEEVIAKAEAEKAAEVSEKAEEEPKPARRRAGRPRTKK